MQDELKLIGVIHERDVDGRITTKELKKIFFEALQLGPMYQPLLEILKKQEKIDPSDYVEIKDVY